MLKKFGYKLCKLDDFKEETVEVKSSYDKESPKCIEARKNGAEILWNSNYKRGYEKYYEIDGNIKRYFTHLDATLWIKRIDSDNK